MKKIPDLGFWKLWNISFGFFTFKYALPYSYGLEKSILRLLNHVRG